MDQTPTPAETFAFMQQNFNPTAAKGLNSTFQWELSGDDGGTWALQFENGECKLIEGGVEKPNVNFKLTSTDWVAIATGKLNAMNAFMTGKLKMEGDMGLAMKVQALFPQP
jgi:putative sterol carrier protein